ncbi:MAG: hypothetical protein WDW36_009038 [Sanguina aurantia]
MDLYGQVLVHADTNAQVECQDICLEYGMRARLQRLDSQSVAAGEAGSGAGASSSAPSGSSSHGEPLEPSRHQQQHQQQQQQQQHPAAGQRAAAAEASAHAAAQLAEEEHLQHVLSQLEAHRATLQQALGQKTAEAVQLGVACKAAASEVQEVLSSNSVWYGSS